MKVSGAIFDLDGTLLDSMYLWDTIGEAYLVSRGITPEPGLNQKFKTMSIVQAAEYYRAVYGIADEIQSIIDGVNGMIDRFYRDSVKTKPGVLRLLERFHTNGVKMCVATATDRYMVEAGLKRNGILDYFCEIFTCTEVGFGKDSPVIYQKALGTLGTRQAETLVFEDAPYAIKTAKTAGFPVVGIYEDAFKAEQQQVKQFCDYYLLSLEDWKD